MEYKRGLTKEDMQEAAAQSDLFKYNDCSPDFYERKAFYHGWLNRAQTLPSETEIAQLKADNEKLRQALMECRPTSETFEVDVNKIDTILSETKTINP